MISILLRRAIQQFSAKGGASQTRAKGQAFVWPWHKPRPGLTSSQPSSQLTLRPGVIMILVFVFLGIVLVLSSAIFTKVTSLVGVNTRSANKDRTGPAIDAAIDYALWKLNTPATANWTGTSDQTLQPSPGPVTLAALSSNQVQFEVFVSTKDINTKKISVITYFPSKTKPQQKQATQIEFTYSPAYANVPVEYATVSAAAGNSMKFQSINWGGGDSHPITNIIGPVYSNGNIQTINGIDARISNPNGDAWAVGTISAGLTVAGAKHPPTAPNASTIQLPLTTSQINTIIDDVKAYAPPANVHSTDVTYSSSQTLSAGPHWFKGNVTVTGASTVVTTPGTLYIEGNLIIQNQGTLKPDNGFGPDEGDPGLIVNKKAIIDTGGRLNKNDNGQYIWLISNCTVDANCQPTSAPAGNQCPSTAYGTSNTPSARTGILVSWTSSFTYPHALAMLYSTTAGVCIVGESIGPYNQNCTGPGLPEPNNTLCDQFEDTVVGLMAPNITFIGNLRLEFDAGLATPLCLDTNCSLAGSWQVNSGTYKALNADKFVPPPVGYWAFNDSDPTDSINNLGGTLSSTPPVFTGAKFGNGLDFANHNTKKVIVGDNNLLDFSKQLTISVWFKRTIVGTSDYIVSKIVCCAPSSSSYDLIFRKNPISPCVQNSLYFEITDGTDSGGYPVWQRICTNQSLDQIDPYWYFATATYDGQNLCIYINGILDHCTASSITIQNTSVSVLIGNADGSIYTSGFAGIIDELKLFNIALSADQVKALYNYYPPGQ